MLQVLSRCQFEARAQHCRVAQSTSPGHIGPTKISGVSCRCRTWSSCQIIIISSTVPMPPGRDDEGVGHEDEVVQAGEERPVLERLLDERVHLLLERQFHPDADGLRRLGGAEPRPRWPPASGPGRRR